MFKFLKDYIKQSKLKFLILMILSVLSWAISLYLPLLNGRLIDIITIGVDQTALSHVIVIISMFSLSNLVMSYFLSLLFRLITAHVVQVINDHVISHIRDLSLKFSYQMNTGYLTQRIVTDSTIVANFTLSSVRDFPLGLVAIVFNVIILIRINVMMGVVLVILIPIYMGLFWAFRKKMYQTNLSYKEAQSHYFEEMHSQIEHMKFIKINALKAMFNQSLWQNFSTFLSQLMTDTQFSTLFANLGAFITACANIIILILGVNEIFAGNLTIGEFTVMTTYFNMVIGNVDYFLNFFKHYQTTLVSYHRLNDILEEEKEKVGSCELKEIQKITLNQVYFSHGSDPLITDFSFTFEKGKVYRINGQNGKGKSTLMDLILGLHDTYQGDITINEMNMKEVNLYQMRRDLVAVIEQDLTVINGSVLQNLQLSQAMDPDRWTYLSERLNLKPFFDKHRLESKLSRKSNGLSGGEKQKLNIVRNLLKESDLLLLDEADAALDVKSRAALKAIINDEKEDRITILISHHEGFEDVVDHEIDL